MGEGEGGGRERGANFTEGTIILLFWVVGLIL